MTDVPDLSSDEDQYEEEDWQEMETENVMVKCLFCDDTFASIEAAVKHCESSHSFNLTQLKAKFNMDCYSYIKLINYIKTHKPSADVVMNSSDVLWNDEKYLKPVENDDWLMYDFDSVSEPPSSPKSYHANVENGVVTLSQSHFVELQKTIQVLTDQLIVGKNQLIVANNDIIKMRETMKTIVDLSVSSPGGEDVTMIDCVSKVPLTDDEVYFNTYAHFGIHYDMLSDKVRTESYRNAILNNKETFKDKTVLDLGCGTGILSMFSATAGAKKVYGIDQSEIVYHAMDIIRENNLHNVIDITKGRLENTNLNDKVDIIVSEWMGYFLLFEGMLDSVIYARDNYLKPGGLLLPNRCNISLVANGDLESHKKLIDFWSDVYGYKMNCMKSEVVREASIEVVDTKHVLSEACIIKDIDINTCNTDVMDFQSTFELQVTRDGTLTSLVGYFDTFFDLPNKVSFSTGPHSTPTHWKQTVFYLRDCKQVKQGDVIKGTIICNRQKTDVRAMSVQIDVFGETNKYILS